MKKKLNLKYLEVKSFQTEVKGLSGGNRELVTDAEGCTHVETFEGCSSGGPDYVLCRPCH